MEIELKYSGAEADAARIDFYDASQAMVGFQRSLALTTHLVLNGEVITQAPALKGATIYLDAIEQGSWKVRAMIVAGIWAIGTAPKETPFGHLIWSAYDYVVSEALGFHVDYEETLGQAYERLQREGENRIPILQQSRFDSLLEKCEKAVLDMHRPIVNSETAVRGQIFRCIGDQFPKVHGNISLSTYDYMVESTRSNEPELVYGKITSYNSNTYKGRIFVPKEGRPVPFELANEARTDDAIDSITTSLSVAAKRSSRGTDAGLIVFKAFRNESRNGRLKSFYVVEVEPDLVAALT